MMSTAVGDSTVGPGTSLAAVEEAAGVACVLRMALGTSQAWPQVAEGYMSWASAELGNTRMPGARWRLSA